jgi:ribulose-bisphosphate carboxylase large chain
MIIKYSDFLDLKYKPSASDLLCLFRVRPAGGITMREAAARVASESSNGTWTGLDVPARISKLSAKCFKIKGERAWIAYPNELFEKGNMPQVVSSIMGNVFGMTALRSLRLEDVRWPRSIIKSFRGPQYGSSGIRDLLCVSDRPITATVPKPKVGFSPDEHARVGLDAWSGGIDLLKDDENLTSQSFNPFNKRLKASMAALRKAEKITGDKKGYLINITAETNEMLRRARLVKKAGNDFVMVDILTVGFSALQTLREETQKLGLAIHAHRAFHSTFTRSPFHGVSMKVIVEMARIIGVDSIHIGALGKLAGDKKEVKDNFTKATSNNKEYSEVLPQQWHSIKPVMPCCSGGLHVGIIKRLIDLLSNDIMLQLGGGVHGHPDGTYSGALALRQALEAIRRGIPLKKFAQEYADLRKALEKWGTKTPK